MAKQQQQQSAQDIAGQFSDEEMEQIKRYGQALGGKPTALDEEVQGHLDAMEAHPGGMEANAARMRTAQMGLAPGKMEEQQAKQTQSITQQAATQGAKQAAQAQAQQTPVEPPAAPSGPTGTSTPYPAQKGSQPPPDVTALPAGEQGEAPPAPGTAANQ